MSNTTKLLKDHSQLDVVASLFHFFEQVTYNTRGGELWYLKFVITLSLISKNNKMC